MFPDAPPLWEKHHNNDVVASATILPPRLTGRWTTHPADRQPAFNQVLTDTQMWQVSLLLANADKPLPSGRAGDPARRAGKRRRCRWARCRRKK